MEKTRIMVIDGSGVSRELIARILSDTIPRAIVTSCKSAAAALKKLSDEQFDLITTSLVLPDMDGLDLCRKIRQSDSHAYVPIVVISGDADERLLEEGFKAGVTDYFDKSRGYKAFGEFIRSFCQRNIGLVGRVILVEDSLTAATLTKRVLEKHGLQVTHTTTAEATLALLQENRKSKSNSYDLVITDFHLKGKMTGGDLLHALRAHLHYYQQELPVLIITGNDDIKTQVEVFHAGANDFVNKPLIEEILMARVRSLLLIKHQYDALQRQAKAMEQAVGTDSLTGTRNRKFLVDHGEQILKELDGRPLSVMLVDIDHLSNINADKGHLVGDHVLAAVGQLLNKAFQDGFVVRFAGEEFAVLLPGWRGDDALQRAEAVRQDVEASHPDGVGVSVSIGAVSSDKYPDAGLDTLLRLADQALSTAKAKGRNQVCLCAGKSTVDNPCIVH